MRALGYAWQIATNIFNFLVVWFVLDQFHQRPEAVIVPILGMLYIAIRIPALGLSLGQVVIGEALENIHERVKEIADPDYRRDAGQLAGIATAIWASQIKFYITGVSLSLIGLLCVWKFFQALPNVNF